MCVCEEMLPPRTHARTYGTKPHGPPHLGPTPLLGPLAHPVRTGALGDVCRIQSTVIHICHTNEWHRTGACTVREILSFLDRRHFAPERADRTRGRVQTYQYHAHRTRPFDLSFVTSFRGSFLPQPDPRGQTSLILPACRSSSCLHTLSFTDPDARTKCRTLPPSSAVRHTRYDRRGSFDTISHGQQT